MANGRSGGRSKRDTGRDAGGFIAIPWAVLDSKAFTTLSHTARSLLFELARQLHGDDNGRLLLSRAHLLKRGWKSAGVIQRAKIELLEAGLIFETVKGHRPNRASWYAVTWRRLDRIAGYDVGVERAFKQGAYRHDMPMLVAKKLRGYQAERAVPVLPLKNAVLIPSHGTDERLIAPVESAGEVAPVPAHGAMRAAADTLSVPSDGNPLDLPSAVVRPGVAFPASIEATARSSDFELA